MDRARATTFFVVNSDTIDTRELIIYRTAGEAEVAEETNTPTRPGDRRRARVIAVSKGVADAIANVAKGLVSLSADAGNARARAAVSGRGRVYNTVFTLPARESELGDDAFQLISSVMHVNDYTYASRMVIAVDLGSDVGQAEQDEQEDQDDYEDSDTDALIAEILAEIAGEVSGSGAREDPRADNVASFEGPPWNPRKISPSGDILSKYFLYGEPPEEQPAEPRPVLNIPWGEFVPGPPRDCLVEGIIAKYSAADIPANRRLSRATVTKFFEKTGPSLEALKSFAETYRIPLRVYDISGSEILSLRTTVSSGSGARRGMGVLAYNGHAYFRDGSIAEDPKLHENMREHDIDTFIDTRMGSGAMEAAELEIKSRFLDWAPLNKSWRAERFIGARALMYVDSGVAGDGWESRVPDAQGWDMSKAYHTSVKKDFSGVGIPIAKDIPIFTAVDDWVVACGDNSDFPRRGAWGRTYFLVKPVVMDSWAESGVAHLAARTNNLLTGPEFEYLFDTKRVCADDIVAWKTATDSVPTGRYEHFTRRGDAGIPDRADLKYMTVLLTEKPGRTRTMPGSTAQARLDKGELTVDDIEGWASTQKSFGAFLDELDGPAPTPDDALGGLTRAQFSTYYGLFGRMSTSAHSLLVSASELDAELLSLAHSKVELRGNDAHVEISKARDLLMNSRTTYDYIVASTSLVMMRLADEVAATGARILKIKTDGIVFDRPVTLPEWAAGIFHREPVRLVKSQIGKFAIDVASMVAKISKEVDEVVEKIVGYVGAPGTGKTHAVKSNHLYHEAMAFSNITARNLDGVVGGADGNHVRGRTLDEGLRLQSPADLNSVCGRARGRTWWIDEISTIKARVWSVIVEVASRGLERLILTGDPNQIPPVMERFRGDSMLIKAILSRAQLLTHDYRNDAGLVDVRERVLKLQAPTDRDGYVDAAKFVLEVHAAHPTLSPKGREGDIAASNVHITHTRAAAARVNRWIATTRRLRFERKGEGPRAKHEIDVGVRLRSCENFKDLAGELVCNGDVFELLERVTPETETVRLRRLGFDAQVRPGGETRVSAKTLHSFELGWAFTTHSTIGITVRGQTMCVYEAERMIETDPAILYTAVTRACTVGSVVLCGNVPAHIK